MLKGAVKSLKKETPKFNYTELLKASHHIKLTSEFLEGKNLLGVVANAIRNHILSQKANIIGVNKLNNTLPLFLFNHNIQELSIIEGQISQLTSYAGTTTKNNFPILSLLSEFLTAYVDIAKDSYIFRLNMTSMVINQVIAMIRAGVNMGDTIKLMNQPIIDEYLKLTSFNESEFAKSNFLDKDNDDIIKDVFEVFRSKGSSNYFKNSLYYYYKKNKTKEFTEKFLAYQQEIKNNPKLFEDTNNKYYQSIILDIFLYQNLVSKPISNLSRVFKDDSIGFKSLDEIYNQEQSFSQLMDDGELLNLENLKYDSILSSFITNNSIIKNKLANFYLVFSPEYINTYNNVVDTFKQKPGSDLARISRVVKDRIFDYIIQNYYSKVFPDDVLPINSISKNTLFSKETGLYKEILEITKPESTSPLKNNIVLNSFIIEDREVTMNLKQQNNSQIDTNKQFYIDSFNEIVKTDPQLADKIFKFAMLQSGKVISDFNFIDIIPADMYYNKVVPIIDYFLQSKAMLNSQEIVKLIAKAHPELLPVLKRTSLVYIKESKGYQYLKDSVNFIEFIEKNKFDYPGIENYSNNYKGFIKKLKQLNVTVDNKLLVVTPIKTSNYKIYESEVKVGFATVRQPVYNEKYTKIYKELQELREDKKENQERIKELEEIMKSATVIYYSYKIYQAVYNSNLSTEKESIYDFIQIGNNSDGRYFVDMSASESISNISNFIPVDEIKTEPTQTTTTQQAIQPTTQTETARTIYAKINQDKKTQSKNVILPEDIDPEADNIGMTYTTAIDFWRKIVPEAMVLYNKQKPLIVAFRGNSKKTFLENYRSGTHTIGNPFDWRVETGTREEQGIKSTMRFIHWMITGDNMGITNATEEYRQAIISDIKSGKIKNSSILYYEEKGYATHATALDYLINEYNWEQPSTQPTERKTYSGKVTSLQPNQIFVFGSNPLGINGNPSKGTGGAALVAYNIAGVKQGEKMDNKLSDSGKAWGMTTVTSPGKKRSKTPQEITEGIKKLYEYAKQNPTKEFLISDYSGTNLNGYTGQEMADMFVNAGTIPSNIVFNENFDKLIPTQPSTQLSTNLPGPETTINIYAGTGENAELSNFAVREFTYNEVNFNSVEQAYQSLKGGEFDKATYDNKAYKPFNRNGVMTVSKFRGPLGDTTDAQKTQLMKELLKQSFEQNPNALAKLLATGNATLTHTQDKGKWGTEFPRLLMEVRDELRGTQPSTQPSTVIPIEPSVTETTIEYTPKGKSRQTYTIRGKQIFNKNNEEVFKGASKDRNRIYANFAVQEGRAVVVDHNNKKYVVNNKNVIISVATGDIMKWPDNNGDRISILNLAQEKFLKIKSTTQPVVSPQDTTKDDIDIKKLRDFYSSLTKEDKFKLGVLEELELEYLNNLDRNIDNYIFSLKCKL